MEPFAGIAALFGFAWLIFSGAGRFTSFLSDQDAKARMRGVIDMRTGEHRGVVHYINEDDPDEADYESVYQDDDDDEWQQDGHRTYRRHHRRPVRSSHSRYRY